MQVDPSDIVVLVISWHFKAASMGEYLRTEFVDGMEDLSCDSTAKLKRRLPSLRTELHDKHKFKVGCWCSCHICTLASVKSVLLICLCAPICELSTFPTYKQLDSACPAHARKCYRSQRHDPGSRSAGHYG